MNEARVSTKTVPTLLTGLSGGRRGKSERKDISIRCWRIMQNKVRKFQRKTRGRAHEPQLAKAHAGRTVCARSFCLTNISPKTFDLQPNTEHSLAQKHLLSRARAQNIPIFLHQFVPCLSRCDFLEFLGKKSVKGFKGVSGGPVKLKIQVEMSSRL